MIKYNEWLAPRCLALASLNPSGVHNMSKSGTTLITTAKEIREKFTQPPLIVRMYITSACVNKSIDIELRYPRTYN